MAGRGRSAGASSLTVDQRAALGLNVRDGHPVPLTPPPLYGKLEAKPGPLPDDPDTSYLVSLKQKIVKQLHARSNENMEKWWPYIPPELTPAHNESLAPKKTKKRKIHPKEDFVTKMSALEEAEKKTSAKETAKEGEKGTENKLDAELEDMEEVEDDNEMDEGTDYADNYFDNGEGFEDDDDNLDDNDDGPIF